MQLQRCGVFAFLLALPAAADPSGNPAACASCHRPQSQFQHGTGMAQALQSAASAPILSTHPNLSFHQGPYAYSIERHGDQSLYRVRSGAEEFSTPIVWAFGLGAAGQTYLLNRDGHWYESRVS